MNPRHPVRIAISCDDRLQFHNEAIFDEKIGKILAENRAVLIAHGQRMLLDDLQAGFPQTMGETVLINFFKMSVPVVAMERKRGFTDGVTQGEDFLFYFCKICGYTTGQRMENKCSLDVCRLNRCPGSHPPWVTPCRNAIFGIG